MKSYIKPGFTYKTNSPVKGALDLEKFVTDTLKKVNVPFVDPCCPQINDVPGAMQAVRWNTVAAKLERYDAVTNAWIIVV